VRKWWPTAVAVVIAASACSTGEGPAARSILAEARDVEIDGVPFLDGATLGPGAELRDGIRVVEGSRVLGDTIPLEYFMEKEGEDLDRGWAAMAVVTGDARQVLDEYASQAVALGLPVPVVSCVERPPDFVDAPPTTTCAGESWSVDRLRSFRIDFVRTPGYAGFEPFSHVWIARQDMSAPPVTTDFFLPIGVPVGDPGRGSELVWLPLPQVGEPYEHPTGSTTPISFVVQEGTQLVGAPGPERQGGVDSVVAVLRVDGDVDRVVDRYRTAFGAGYEHHSSSDQEGVQVDHWYWTSGDTATVDVYRRDGHPTWMMVWHALGD
jgi:hypothetical protein